MSHQESFPFNFEIAAAGNLNLADPDLRPFLGSLIAVLRFAVDCVPLAANVLDVFVLSLPEDKAAAIYELQDRAGVQRAFTEANQSDSIKKTAAKTIGRKLPDGSVISSVVYDAVYLAAIHDLIQEGSPVAEWNAESQEFLYIFAHEFGHCRDNFIRRDARGDTIDLKIEKEWTKVCFHYARVLTSEFLACFYSAGAVTEKLHDKQIEDWHRDALDCITSAQNCRRNPFCHTLENAVHNLWFVMLQYAKLIGSACDNPDLPLPALWTGAPAGARSVFERLRDFLQNKLSPGLTSAGEQLHPAQDPDFDLEQFVFENTFGLWKDLSKAYDIQLIYVFDDPRLNRSKLR